MKRKKGFTLIELLIVVIIIGVLATIAIPQFTKATERSKAAEAYMTIGNIRTQEAIYYAENSEYTDDLALLDDPVEPVGRDWAFTVEIAPPAYDPIPPYIVTATRNAGIRAGSVIIVDKDGNRLIPAELLVDWTP